LREPERLPIHTPGFLGNTAEIDLDSTLDRLLSVRGSQPGKPVQFLEVEIQYLCTKARGIFLLQPMLLEIKRSNEGKKA